MGDGGGELLQVGVNKRWKWVKLMNIFPLD